MAIQKKHGKGRLDKWYKLAKQKGYRARAAFKLIQLNRKYGFLEKSKVLIDLCAAPGSWCQVAAEVMPSNSLIVGVDLAPIKQIPKVITFQSDITTEKCRATLRSHLKHWKCDTVLHDGAPNVGTAWVQDSFNQAELVLQSLKLATEFLIKGGTFVTKVFRSRDFNSLMWVFNQLFEKVEATKPPSSRNVSAEIFVVCRGYKAPARVDPKFLDARTVFEELPDAAPNNEAKVYNPEKKKRKRDGYEEGDYIQFKEIPVSEFIETIDPISLLGSISKFSFENKNNDITMAAIDKLPETTLEVRNCCEDLKVLGKRDFRLLLKWRLSVREKFGLAPKKEEAKGEEVAEINDMDEDERIEHDLKLMRDREIANRKRDKRKSNEQKTKEIIRMQLHMMAPTEIGLEQEGPLGEDSMFALKAIEKAGGLSKVVKGKMNVIVEHADNTKNNLSKAGIVIEGDESEEEDLGEVERLEEELDAMYDQYQERKSQADIKFRAKKARKEHEDGEWAGIDSDKEAEESEDEVLVFSGDDDSDEEEAGPRAKESLIKTFNTDGVKGAKGLTKRAERFFDQDIFKDLAVDDFEEEEELVDEDYEDYEDDDEVMDDGEEEAGSDDEMQDDAPSDADSDWEADVSGLKPKSLVDGEQSGFEVVSNGRRNDEWDGNASDGDQEQDIDIITAEAMTLAQSLASGESRRTTLIDDSYNRYSFREKDGLPEWFIDDEDKHSRPSKPITAAGAAAIKEKLRALNARPIKKVREAKDRKKFKAAQRLEKLRKKSSALAEDEGMTEKDKAQSITSLMAKSAKKKPPNKVKVVVARGANKGNKGRPKGVKGRYKIVDSRMKKDVRAMKRLKKKMK
ncbi:AdoMet-dependent rRNA methyltransferase-like protein spb1 [Peziza echinospora]|nr:AdoMet-dependent rRNA methyltransferase-like protein spb1 [Peziza echinospora]